MKLYDLYGGLFWLLMAVFLGGIGLKFGLGTLNYPGPGFFPCIVSVILLGLSVSLITLARHEKRKRTDATFAQRPSFDRSVLFTLAILLLYAFALEVVGYILDSFALMLYLFKVPGQHRWGFSLLSSIVMVALIYYFFGVLLQAQFPKGIFNLG
jgi:hypothetical protein